MKTSRRKGVSLIELCIVMALMSMVMLLCVSLISLTVKGVTSAEQLANTAMADADFAAKIADAVRKSTTSYTIPKNSFVEENLTHGWNYLGLMEGVTVKAGASRTGQEIQNVNALVYLEWIGDTLPAEGAYDENRVTIIDRIAEGDGVFIQYVISHDYTDLSGVTHEYSLVFEPTDPSISSPQMITWSLSATADYGEDTGVTSFDTMMQALNAAQVVYQGDPTNPAVALAFHSNYFPTNPGVTTIEETGGGYEGTIILVLESTTSMNQLATAWGLNWSCNNVMQKAVMDFIDKLSLNCPDVNILLVVNGGQTWDSGVNWKRIDAYYDTDAPMTYVYADEDWLPCITVVKVGGTIDPAIAPEHYPHIDAEHYPGVDPVHYPEELDLWSNRAWLKRSVDSIQANGSSNLGDALRYAWYQLNCDAELGEDSLVGDKPILILVLADGGVNVGTYKIAYNTDGSPIYTNSYYFPENYADHFFDIKTGGDYSNYDACLHPVYSYVQQNRYNKMFGVKCAYTYNSLSGPVQVTSHSPSQSIYHLGDGGNTGNDPWGYAAVAMNHITDKFGFVTDEIGEKHERITKIVAPVFLNGGFSNEVKTKYENLGFRVDNETLGSLNQFDTYFNHIIGVEIPELMWVCEGPRT